MKSMKSFCLLKLDFLLNFVLLAIFNNMVILMSFLIEFYYSKHQFLKVFK